MNAPSSSGASPAVTHSQKRGPPTKPSRLARSWKGDAAACARGSRLSGPTSPRRDAANSWRIGAVGSERQPEPAAEPAEDAGASAGAGEDKVAAVLKGKLIGLKEGNIADAELSGNPEYYVFYHSASW